ncbi:hypothetical protein ABPG72_007196 [Tetrahymena utriculariae]
MDDYPESPLYNRINQFLRNNLIVIINQNQIKQCYWRTNIHIEINSCGRGNLTSEGPYQLVTGIDKCKKLSNLILILPEEHFSYQDLSNKIKKIKRLVFYLLESHQEYF